MTAPLPYSEVTEERYAQLAAQHFRVEEPGDGTLILRGPCPRCGTTIEVPVVRSVVRTWWRRPTPEPVAPHVEPMMCTCEDEHPDRPEGRYGCGAYWTLTITAS